MGYSRRETEDSLREMKYDDIFATYLLLCRMKRPSEEPEITATSTSAGKALPSSLLRCDTTPVSSISGTTTPQGPTLQGATSTSSTAANRPVHRAASTAAAPTHPARRPSSETTQAPPTNGTSVSGRRVTSSGASRSSSTSTEDHASPRASVKDFNGTSAASARGTVSTGKSLHSPSSPTGVEGGGGGIHGNLLPVYGGDSKAGQAKGISSVRKPSGPSFRTGTGANMKAVNSSTHIHVCVCVCATSEQKHQLSEISFSGVNGFRSAELELHRCLLPFFPKESGSLFPCQICNYGQPGNSEVFGHVPTVLVKN